jgi:saccharopine dehydrogenase-like NADP-dependent oxidoreductase
MKNAIAASAEKMTETSRRYREDPDYRRRLDESPRLVLAELGVDPGVEVLDREVALHVDEPDTWHVCLGENPNGELSEEDVAFESRGGVAAGSVSSILTLGTIPSCAGSAGSIGTVAV